MKPIASIQDFCAFPPELEFEQIIKTTKSIKALLPDDVKTSGMLKSGQKIYSRIDSLDAIQDAFIDCGRVPDQIQINFMGGSKRLCFIFQFSNEHVGPNGNYTIESGSEDLNLTIESFLRSQLKLEKLKINGVKNKDSIVTTPIFKNRTFKTENNYVFVLMPFIEVWSDLIWKTLENHIPKLGFKCKRADNLYGHNVIEDIWTGINEASVIVADITSRNPNVFYEIGIAHTLGKRVILITQDREALPFDFRVYRVIFYENHSDGLTTLCEQVEKFLQTT